MSRYKFAAFTSLLALSLVGNAQAQDDPVYNLASDWATTFPSTTVLNTATSATWGVGNVWSAGELSFNWTNYGAQTEDLQHYYSATPTVASTSGTVATYTYTVPFQAYQLNPGTSIHQQVGPVAGNTLQSALVTAQGSTIGLRSETGTGTTSSGTINQLAHIENIISAKGTEATGFTTLGFSTTAQIQDGASGNNKSGADTPGVFYNYSTTNYTSGGGSGVAMNNVPSSVTNNTLTLDNGVGPTYVAWTAPSAGTITAISLAVWDMRESSTDNDEGFNNFYVVTALNNGVAPNVATPLVTGIKVLGDGGTQTASVGTVAVATVAPIGYTENNQASGITWSASNISVTAGEVFYFVGDPTHSGGNHNWVGSADGMALQVNMNFVPTPEPASLMLLVTGGIGLALAGWRKWRSPTA